jgi:hypothetical protein
VLGLSVPDTQSAQDSPPEQQAPSDVTTQLPHIGPHRNKIWVAPAHPLGLGKQFGIQIHRSNLARLNQLAHGFGTERFVLPVTWFAVAIIHFRLSFTIYQLACPPSSLVSEKRSQTLMGKRFNTTIHRGRVRIRDVTQGRYHLYLSIFSKRVILNQYAK